MVPMSVFAKMVLDGIENGALSDETGELRIAAAELLGVDQGTVRNQNGWDYRQLVEDETIPEFGAWRDCLRTLRP